MDPEPSFQLLATLDTNLLFGIIGIIILLFFSAMISGSEVALFSLSQSDLDELNSKNSSKANIINELLAKPKKLLATILVANNFINIGLEAKGYTTTILDLSGKVVLQSKDQQNLDTSKLKNGVYMVQVTMAGESTTKKIIIKK